MRDRRLTKASGVFWEAGMTGPDELCVLVTWDDAQLSQSEIESHLCSLNRIIEWLIVPENWGKAVGDII
jgi:hypothetical protein